MSGLSDVTVENGHYVVKTDVDEDRLLIITAPYENGWKAFVDGQAADIVAYEDAFLAVPLSAGAHTVELRFTPPGWTAGLLASAAGLLLFVAMTIVCLRPKSHEEKNDTKTDNEEEKT